MKRNFWFFTALCLAVFGICDVALASEAAGAVSGGGIAGIGAGAAVGLAALGGGMGQGRAVGSALESISRNPSASGKLFVPMILGLVFIETLVIFSFVIAYFLVNKI